MEETGMLIEQKLQALDIDLQSPAAPIANYVTALRVGNLIFLSGASPLRPGKALPKGKLGADFTVEQGYAAARDCAINLIAALKNTVGDLDGIKQIVKLTGFVNCTPDFASQPQVINGASDLLVEVFGDRGRHTRSAVGANALPNGIPVEIELIAECRQV